MHQKRKRLSLYIVFLIAFVDWIGVGLVYPIFSSMFFDVKNSLFLPESSEAVKGFWLGVLLAIMPLAQFISAPILGAISDRKGRKPVLIGTLLFCLMGYFVSAFGVWDKNLLFLIFGRLIVGIASGNVAIATSVVADLSLSEEKIKNFGFLHMAAGVGFVIGPFLGGKLSQGFFLGIEGFDKPFLFAMFLTFLNLILLIYLFKETYQSREKTRVDFLLYLKKLKQALSSRDLRNLLICIFVFRFGWAFYWEFIPVMWIEEYQLTTSKVGDFYAYSAGFYALSCGILIRPIIGKLTPFFILFFALIITGFYLFLSLFIEPKWLWFYLPFQQYLTAFLFPTAAAIVSDLTARTMQGEIMGIYQSVESLAFGLGPIISGCLVGISYKMPILVGGTSMILAAFILGVGVSKEAFVKQKGFL